MADVLRGLEVKGPLRNIRGVVGLGFSTMQPVNSRSSCLLMLSTERSRPMISTASSELPSTKAVMLSRNISCAISAISGISINGFSKGSIFNSRVRRAIFVAWSAMRSRLLEIFEAASISRQSLAIGPCVAM